ncbi:hypothetical protein AVEN_180512-1 [Araneus ventricosus]|uniref:Uncharacterized protein n=1 Tax=Araneus ventricosus TaxID=182803 RepID=A0A4Y2N8P7_ARAVE|nr:hypothetical protein AVEN_180512-1 [Araneus ventricosus]
MICIFLSISSNEREREKKKEGECLAQEFHFGPEMYIQMIDVKLLFILWNLSVIATASYDAVETTGEKLSTASFKNDILSSPHEASSSQDDNEDSCREISLHRCGSSMVRVFRLLDFLPWKKSFEAKCALRNERFNATKKRAKEIQLTAIFFCKRKDARTHDQTQAKQYHRNHRGQCTVLMIFPPAYYASQGDSSPYGPNIKFSKATFETLKIRRKPECTSIHDIVPRVSNKPVGWNREEIMFVTGYRPFPSYLHRIDPRTHGNCSCGEKGDPIHYATKCRFTLSWHFQTTTVSLKLQWLKNILTNNLSRAQLRLLMRFICDENNLIVEDNN